MNDANNLEDEVRRALRATADAVVVEDRDFDPSAGTVGQPTPVRAHRTQRRVLAAVVVVVVLVAAALIVSQTGTSNKDVSASATSSSGASKATGLSDSSSQPAPAALVSQMASVPVSALDAVGEGTASPLPIALPGPRLIKDGKPRIVWIGAEWCPFCGAERWPLIVALSRFGSFSNLRVTKSAGSPEVYPNTQTFSFHGSTYSSPSVAFDADETATNVKSRSDFFPLDTPTPDEQALYREFDAPPYVPASGAIPFLDFANAYLISGATYAPEVLQGKSASEIANALSDPNSTIAQGVDGSANLITAVICKLTNDQPASVCSDPVITRIKEKLKS